LLGLISEGRGVAAQVLVEPGADLEKVRVHVRLIQPSVPIGMLAERVHRAVALAQDEAKTHNHGHIDTEHMLLGLLREGEGVAARALTALGITVEAVRQQVEEITSQDHQPPSANTPATPD
jgi:hypothetical protein